MTRKTILYTDGACSPNPGPGGWAYLVVHHETGEILREDSGWRAKTTNNRMELQAVVEGLESIRGERQEILVFSDSKYVVQGASEWLSSWKKRGWRTSSGTDVVNRDLWEDLDMLLRRHSVRFRWVKGHAENPFNQRADELAVLARQSALFLESSA